MNDASWLGIEALALGNVGDTIDVLSDAEYTGVTLIGVEYLHNTVSMNQLGDSGRSVDIGSVETMRLHHLHGTIDLDHYAKWRKHV